MVDQRIQMSVYFLSGSLWCISRLRGVSLFIFVFSLTPGSIGANHAAFTAQRAPGYYRDIPFRLRQDLFPLQPWTLLQEVAKHYPHAGLEAYEVAERHLGMDRQSNGASSPRWMETCGVSLEWHYESGLILSNLPDTSYANIA